MSINLLSIDFTFDYFDLGDSLMVCPAVLLRRDAANMIVNSLIMIVVSRNQH